MEKDKPLITSIPTPLRKNKKTNNSQSNFKVPAVVVQNNRESIYLLYLESSKSKDQVKVAPHNKINQKYHSSSMNLNK